MARFIWCDLSALRLDKAAAFYGEVLGWHVEPGDYRYAFCGEEPVAGLFDMPAFFRKINMPSFWMSYIQVPSVADAVAAATAHGGKVELEEGFGDGGRIALIRDPLGAGFTVYEGAMQPGASGVGKPGLRAAHDLHISDVAAVAGFYEALSGWTVGQQEGETVFLSHAGQVVAHIHETSDEMRGGFQYWGITFTVTDLDRAARTVEAQGGTVYLEMSSGGRRVLAAADMDSAAFFLTDGAKA